MVYYESEIHAIRNFRGANGLFAGLRNFLHPSMNSSEADSLLNTYVQDMTDISNMPIYRIIPL